MFLFVCFFFFIVFIFLVLCVCVFYFTFFYGIVEWLLAICKLEIVDLLLLYTEKNAWYLI